MHKILLSLLIASFISAKAQQDFRKTYYPLINRAELLISEAEYGAALSLYDEAFGSLAKPHPRDLYNALVCKLLMNDFEGGKIYLLKLAQQGIRSSSLEKKEIFEIMLNQDKWNQYKPTYEEFFLEKSEQEVFKSEFDRLDALRKLQFAIDRKKFTAVKSEDSGEVQFVRNVDFWKYQNLKEGKEKIERFSRLMVEEVTRLLEIEEKDIYFEAKNILSDLLEKRGFMPEGFSLVEQFMHPQDPIFTYLSVFDYNVNDLEIRDGKPVFVQKEWITKEDIKLYHQKLSEAVKNGRLHPSLAAKESFMMHSFNHVKVSFFKIILENNSNCPDEFDAFGNYCFYKKNELSKEEKAEYKFLQKEFGVESLEDKYRKEVFSASRNKYFVLFTTSTYEESTVPNCEVAQKMMEGATTVTLD